MSIDRELFKKGPGLVREKVPLPEYGDGEYVWVHTLTALEYRRLVASMRAAGDSASDLDNGLAIAECCRDDDGNRLYGPEDAGDLLELPNPIVQRLVEVIWRLNEPTTVEKLAKNSDAATPDGT